MKNDVYTVHFSYSGVHFCGVKINIATPDPVPDFVAATVQEKTFLQLLVTAIAPARIYKVVHKNLFEQQEDYTDFLLILSQRCTVPFTELEPLLETAGLKDCTSGCSLHREHTVCDALKNGHVFYTCFITDKNLVYDDGTIVFPQIPEELRAKMRERVLNQFTFFQEKAKCFYESAVSLYDNYTPPVIVFMLHQAVELTYRAILENLNGYGKKTHDIRVLSKQTRRCAPQLGNIFPDNTAEEQRLVSLLNAAYLASRYDSNYTISNKDLNILIKRIKLFMETAKRVFEEILAG